MKVFVYDRYGPPEVLQLREVEALGENVTGFKVGDLVFAFGGRGMACHAEYRCRPEDGSVVPSPASLSLEEAAAIQSRPDLLPANPELNRSSSARR